LFVLSIYEGVAWSGTALPFLHDIAVYARFLVAVPLLLLAEIAVHAGLRSIAQEFVESDVLPDKAVPAFRASVERVMRLRNSPWIEVALLVLVLLAGP